MKTAFITGITGQDGYYLAQLLLRQNYRVIGLYRRASTNSTYDRIQHIKNDNFELRYYNLLDPSAIYRYIDYYHPDEIYNLGAQSDVGASFDVPLETLQTIVLGTAYILEAIRTLDTNIRFYQASSSEMFGANSNVPLNEDSKMIPQSPYACAKLAAHHLVRNYREAYDIFACSGILFNHETPLRGEKFVTKKITKAAARIVLGKQDTLILGNLYAKRDWGFGPEYCIAIYKMLQQIIPEDFVIASGQTHTVYEFLKCVFQYAGLDVDKHVIIDPGLFRPNEVDILLGDASKAKKQLLWEAKTTMPELAVLMYEYDLEMEKLK